MFLYNLYYIIKLTTLRRYQMSIFFKVTRKAVMRISNGNWIESYCVEFDKAKAGVDT